jgi:hypothetical protein
MVFVSIEQPTLLQTLEEAPILTTAVVQPLLQDSAVSADQWAAFLPKLDYEEDCPLRAIHNQVSLSIDHLREHRVLERALTARNGPLLSWLLSTFEYGAADGAQAFRSAIENGLVGHIRELAQEHFPELAQEFTTAEQLQLLQTVVDRGHIAALPWLGRLFHFDPVDVLAVTGDEDCLDWLDQNILHSLFRRISDCTQVCLSNVVIRSSRAVWHQLFPGELLQIQHSAIKRGWGDVLQWAVQKEGFLYGDWLNLVIDQPSLWCALATGGISCSNLYDSILTSTSVDFLEWLWERQHIWPWTSSWRHALVWRRCRSDGDWNFLTLPNTGPKHAALLHWLDSSVIPSLPPAGGNHFIKRLQHCCPMKPLWQLTQAAAEAGLLRAARESEWSVFTWLCQQFDLKQSGAVAGLLQDSDADQLLTLLVRLRPDPDFFLEHVCPDLLARLSTSHLTSCFMQAGVTHDHLLQRGWFGLAKAAFPLSAVHAMRWVELDTLPQEGLTWINGVAVHLGLLTSLLERPLSDTVNLRRLSLLEQRHSITKDDLDKLWQVYAFDPVMSDRLVRTEQLMDVCDRRGASLLPVPALWTSEHHSLACKRAASRGHVQLLQHLTPTQWTEELVWLAAMYNRLDVLRWAHQLQPHGLLAHALGPALEHGHLSLVQWLVTREPVSIPCHLLLPAMEKALERGHLHCLTLVVENQGRGRLFDSASGALQAWLCDTAADGELSADRLALQHWKTKVVPQLPATLCADVPTTVAPFVDSARQGHAPVVRHFLDYHRHLLNSEAVSDALGAAASHGRRTIVTTIQRECAGVSVIPGRILKSCVQTDRCDMLQWTMDTLQLTVPQETAVDLLHYAVGRGHWHCVRWLRKYFGLSPDQCQPELFMELMQDLPRDAKLLEQFRYLVKEWGFGEEHFEAELEGDNVCAHWVEFHFYLQEDMPGWQRMEPPGRSDAPILLKRLLTTHCSDVANYSWLVRAHKLTREDLDLTDRQLLTLVMELDSADMLDWLCKWWQGCEPKLSQFLPKVIREGRRSCFSWMLERWTPTVGCFTAALQQPDDFFLKKLQELMGDSPLQNAAGIFLSGKNKLPIHWEHLLTLSLPTKVFLEHAELHTQQDSLLLQLLQSRSYTLEDTSRLMSIHKKAGPLAAAYLESLQQMGVIGFPAELLEHWGESDICNFPTAEGGNLDTIMYDLLKKRLLEGIQWLLQVNPRAQAALADRVLHIWDREDTLKWLHIWLPLSQDTIASIAELALDRRHWGVTALLLSWLDDTSRVDIGPHQCFKVMKASLWDKHMGIIEKYSHQITPSDMEQLHLVAVEYRNHDTVHWLLEHHPPSKPQLLVDALLREDDFDQLGIDLLQRLLSLCGDAKSVDLVDQLRWLRQAVRSQSLPALQTVASHFQLDSSQVLSRLRDYDACHRGGPSIVNWLMATPPPPTDPLQHLQAQLSSGQLLPNPNADLTQLPSMFQLFADCMTLPEGPLRSLQAGILVSAFHSKFLSPQ